MFARQKVALAVLERAGRPLAPTVFVKMMFLLRQKTTLGSDASFYDFVPYKFGPFSFALYRDLDGLRGAGYVAPGEEQIQLASQSRQQTRSVVEGLAPATVSAVTAIVDRYAGMKHAPLLKQVYSEYPWFASRSELAYLVKTPDPKRPKANIAVYTVGYEGKSVDGFFDGLLRAGIETILDVRANPISRKYGFARKSMADIAQKLGLDYQHFPELGIVSEERTDLNDRAAYQRLLDRYEREMLPRQPDALRRIVEAVLRSPSAMLCMERDVTCCHRGRLAQAVAARTELPIAHL
jgi:uncharacterized protein (DUF488 family)